jgi:cellulose synthase/poly-beta-1,6-N-acetylglucosamine synthase-like glycosyltransferase
MPAPLWLPDAVPNESGLRPPDPSVAETCIACAGHTGEVGADGTSHAPITAGFSSTMALELAILSCALLLLGLHPFLLYPASLRLLAWLARRPIAGWQTLPGDTSVAICVCAYNEEAVIQAKIENLLAFRDSFPRLELLFYVDAATDGTADILRAYGNQIRLIVSPERHGKTYGMNLLVAATQAEFVVFSDANVMFAPNAVLNLLRPFGDPTVGCVCGHLIYTMPGDSGTAAIGAGYWKREEALKELESRTGSTMGADGSIFAIRRSLHRPAPPDIIDDMFVSLSILCGGHRVVRAADAIAYEPIVSQPGEEFDRKVRIACQAFNVHRILASELRRLPMLDRYKYVSHKLLRWLTVYFLVAGGILLSAALAVTGAWGALAAVLGTTAFLALIGFAFPHGAAAKLLHVAGALLATGLGVLRSFQGERFQTWTPPASSRSFEARP